MAQEQSPKIEIATDIKNVTKRDGLLAEFDESKIYNAILKAGTSTGEFGESDGRQILYENRQTVFRYTFLHTPGDTYAHYKAKAAKRQLIY